jgi:hypothetical protein
MTYGKTYRMLEADQLLARQRESLIRSVELNRYTEDKSDPNKKLNPFRPSCYVNRLLTAIFNYTHIVNKT